MRRPFADHGLKMHSTHYNNKIIITTTSSVLHLLLPFLSILPFLQTLLDLPAPSVLTILPNNAAPPHAAYFLPAIPLLIFMTFLFLA